MRKLYSAFLLLFSFTLISIISQAQAVGTYVFAPAAGTYTALSGATASTAIDDDGTQNTAIGFNFVLGGVSYPNVVISTNGALKLAADGTVAFATSWTNNLSNTYGAAIIAPLWDDNNAVGGTVSYQLAGAAPNRTFTVEWNNIHISGVGSPTNPTASFQVILFEGSNNIRFIYGTVNALTGASIGIGLNDLTSFLSVTPAATPTASSTTANNAIATNANITSGLIYNFFPPPPCAPGSLNGGTAVGPTGTVCPGVPFTITISSASFGTGLTYQWESSPDGTTWTDISGATGVSLAASTSVTTHYRRKMTCSGTTVPSTTAIVNTTPPVSVLPWTENFDGLATVGTTSFPTCWFKENGDWTTRNAASVTYHDPRSTPYYLTNSWSATNEFMWTNGFQLTAGTSYDFSFWFAGDALTGWTGDVFVGNAPLSTGATQMGGSFITSATVSSAGVYAQVKRTFVPATSGVYYFGVRVNATSNPWYLAFDDFRLEVTPPCAPPTGLSVTGLTTTTAVLNWLASVTPPGSGYEWELRTSGAAGSGATGLAASGVTGAGVLTANAAGLISNTSYTLYVRSACIAGSLYSSWSTGLLFNTPCNPLAIFPFVETFEVSSTTRACWNVKDYVSGGKDWTYGAGAGNGGAVTAAHGGSLNAQFFGNGTGAVTRLVSPALNLSSLTTSGADLVFWYANQNWLGDQNELRVYYKTSPTGAWTLLPGAVYTANIGAWTEVEIPNLPGISSEYYIAFEGVELFGYGVAIDDVTIKAAPSCRKVTAVSAFASSPTSATVSFTSLGNSFVVEYGPVGFVPGTTNTAGGGTVVLGAASPIVITGLTASTNYDVYVRRICVPGVDFSENVKTTVTTLCPAVNIPYAQNFESAVTPAGFPTCTSMQDVNGNSGPDANVNGGRWTTFTGTSNQVYVSPTKSLRYLYDFANPARGADDWFFIQGLNLVAGNSYRLKFFYKGSDGPTWVERLEVKYGNEAKASAMTNTLYTNNNINTALASPWDSARADFTPATTGVYYIGFHATSLPDQAFLYIDDISVRVAPLVDAGVTGIVGTLPNCPSTNTVVKAVVRNFNLTPLNFATYPVTVTASITGAATTTLTTIVNTGTLAPGATMEVSLPGYSFASGLYNISFATSQANDPETQNDAYLTSVYVNPTPAVSVFTPTDPRTCAILSTQFATPPAAPVALPAVTSGALTLAIPDGSATGVTHTLAVSGVPAGAVVTDIAVTINATHTWNADLIFNLKAPNGKIYNLVNGTRGGSGDNFVNCIISSASTTVLPTGNVTITGTFAADGTAGIGPTGSVSNASSWAELYSIGNGNWTLSAMDDAAIDGGTLTSWSITITYGTPHPVVTWSPASGLFTNAAGTIPYVAGTNAYAVYANPDTTTIYTVTSTSAAGCTSSSTVTVRSLVDVTALPAKVCLTDEVISLNATPAGGVWSGIGISGNNFIPVATAIGTYPLTYRYTNANGCTTVTVVNAKVQDCPERIILLRDNAVILYPNPNTGRFFVRINSVLYNHLTMRVYSNTGALVYNRELTGLAFNRVIPIDLTHLPQGAYMVQFYYDGGVRTSDKVFPVIIGR